MHGRALQLTAAVAILATGCAAPGAGPGPEGAGASEEIWASLARERPAPLPGAPRVAVSEIVPLGADLSRGLPGGTNDAPARTANVADPTDDSGSGRSSPATPTVGLQELVSLGLIRRRDVHFVERRRFGPAAELERRGERRSPDAPPVGSSAGAQIVLSGTWSPTGPDSATLELRLTDATSGAVLATRRSPTPRGAELASLARTAVGGLLAELEALDRRPTWDDPLEGSGLSVAPTEYRDAGIGPEATAAFLRGLAAEDRWEWERARVGYERALDEASGEFFEAGEALARTARLRAGGSLGES